MKKTLEQQYKEETGLNAYEPNNMRPNIPEDVYVEWLEDKIEQLALCNVSCSLPSKEEIHIEADKYQDKQLNDPLALTYDAFIDGCNYIINKQKLKTN